MGCSRTRSSRARGQFCANTGIAKMTPAAREAYEDSVEAFGAARESVERMLDDG